MSAPTYPGNAGPPSTNVRAAPVPVTFPAAAAASASPLLPAYRLPRIDVTRLDYTMRDWERWDTFDSGAYSRAKRKRSEEGRRSRRPDESAVTAVSASVSVSASASAAVAASSSTSDSIDVDMRPGEAEPDCAASAYFLLFHRETVHRFSFMQYKRYRDSRAKMDAAGAAAVDPCEEALRTRNVLEVERLVLRISGEANEEYHRLRERMKDRFRSEIRAAMMHQQGRQIPIDVTLLDRQTDLLFDTTDIDFYAEPTFAPVRSYLTHIVRLHLGLQCLDPSSTTSTPRYGVQSNYGLWPNAKGEFEHLEVRWTCTWIGYFYAHYMHLLDNDDIRAVRRAMYASIAAQYQVYLLTNPVGGGGHHSESQWILRIAGFVQMTFAILRGEDEMKRRGAWIEPQDAVRHTDMKLGLMPNEELLSLCERLLEEFSDRMIQEGQKEYLSSYHGYTMDILGDLLQHAPSQRCYDICSNMMRRMHFEMAAHWHVSSGGTSGPSGRQYDSFSGLRNKQHGCDLHYFLKHVFQPYCSVRDPSILCRTYSDATEIKRAIDLGRLLAKEGCLPPGMDDAPLMHAPSADICFNYMRQMLACLMCSGAEKLPLDMLIKIALQSPIRLIEQRQSRSDVAHFDRINVIHPLYQIGHASEDVWIVPLGVFACARIGGPPKEGAPRAHGNDGVAQSISFVRTISLTGSDRPFHWQGGRKWPGENQQCLGRWISVQYQGFMLQTSLLAPTYDMSDEVMRGSWSTCMALPLGAMELWADDVRLPTSVGSMLRLPPGTVFTVRHHAASIVLRLVSSTSDEHIPQAPCIAPITDPAERKAVELGRHPYTLVWQVDEDSTRAACGRITLIHKHHQDPPPSSAGSSQPVHPGIVKPYRAAWLWCCGETRTDSEVRSLVSLVQCADVTEQCQCHQWNERMQPRRSQPPPFHPGSHEEVGWKRWTISVHIGHVSHTGQAVHDESTLTLTVDRTDVYQPWTHDPIFKQPHNGPMFKAPYYTRHIHRLINGQPAVTWKPNEDAYRIVRVRPHEVYEPHRVGKNHRVMLDRADEQIIHASDFHD